MDIFAIFFLAVVSMFVGIILTLTVQYYLVYVYFKKSPEVKPASHKKSADYSLPEAIKKQLERDEFTSDKETGSSLPLSLVLQFLFHELRHSETIKRWLYKKLSLELEELLNKTTMGKLFDSINIKDMNLGTQFPDIKDISIDNVKLDKKEGYIESVSLCLDLDYNGNFLLCLDAKLKFGKTAYLSIKVKKISGLARLQFTRHPYTHWSFSFFNEPIMELAVESHFQGRQLQSNITNLIVNQIKKAIRRKHTLPNYKIRYKPFFVKTDPSQLDTEDNEIIPQGQLDVTCVEISRLSLPSNIQNIYCTFAVDSIPWISLYPKNDAMYMTLEITMTKLRQAQLGVVFKQEQNFVIVDSVTLHGCAYKSGLRANDVVLSVENRPVNTVPQVAKLIKSISTVNITLRVERLVENSSRWWGEESEQKNTTVTPELEEAELTQTEQDNFVIVDSIKKEEKKRVTKIMPTNENVSKFAQTIGNFSLRKRKTSVSEKQSVSEKNTPTSSNPGTPQHSSLKQMSNITVSQYSVYKNSISDIPEGSKIEFNNYAEVYRGKELPVNDVLQFNEDFQFNLKDGLKYLNINVWATFLEEKDVLVGYTNIPLSHILNECCGSVLGHYIRCYSFLPPSNTVPNNQTHPLLSHSGFEHVFCYGDILLSFVWNHDEDIELKRKQSHVNLTEDEEKIDNLTSGKHDFIRTQFHRTTHCDFCSKKIWLKDAVQCRQCGMCCHKKCIAKCQTSTGCNPREKPTIKSEVSISEVMLQPEITMTEVTDEVDPQNFNSSMKRVNSVNNLAIPGSQFVGSTSRSLPQSPQRTPSRKQSLSLINPFAMCPSVLDEVQKNPREASESVNRLLEQIMACPPDETLMDNAKESGKQLYANMNHDERVEKINIMMAELKKTLDTVTLEHMDLTKKMSAEESEVEKAKIAFLMGQADAKVHGLSVLMLHYCSSLQHSQENKIV